MTSTARRLRAHSSSWSVLYFAAGVALAFVFKTASARATSCDDDEFEQVRQLENRTLEPQSADGDPDVEAMKWSESATLRSGADGFELQAYTVSIEFVAE